MKSKHSRLWVALFFLVLLAVGLFTSGDYGLPCDEPAEQVILQENMKEYAVQFLGEDSEAVAYYDSLPVQRISQSVERDHGQSAYYLAVPLLALAPAAPDLMTTLWHAYTFLWFLAGVFAIYAFGREMGWTRPVACLCALLLYLCPRFFAEGHYNNKDMVLLSLFLITLWLGLRLWKKPCFLRGFLFSLAGALAANTKIVGIFPWGLMGLGALALITARKAWNQRTLGVTLATVGSFVLFYALLTPALWPDPAGYLTHVVQNASGFTRWTGVILYRDMVVDQQRLPLPRLYLPYTMAVTLPLYTLALAGIGQIQGLFSGWRALQKGKLRLEGEACLMPFLLTLCWLLPVLYAVLARPILYNGWRHFYFVYAGLVLLAGQGLHWLFRRTRGLALAAVLSCLLYSAVGIALNHPFQYAYYNVLAQSTAAQTMELDYWDVSTVNAMKRLAVTQERDSSLPLVLGSRDEMSHFGVSHGHAVLPEALRQKLRIAEDPDAPYLFFNATYAKIYGTPPPAGYHVLFALQSYGNVICTVYEKDG